MAHFGDGLAIDGDLVRAAERAAEQATSTLSTTPDLVCAFVAGGEPDEVAAATERVSRVSGGRVVLGAGAYGVLAGPQGVEGRPAVSVLAGVLPGARLRTFHLECMQAEDGMAVLGMPDPEAGDIAVLLADPYSFPAAGFVTRTAAAMPDLPVIGGLTSGGQGAGSTRLHVDGRTVSRGAVGVLIGGSGATAIVSQGCRPVGPEMTVTAAAGNVVQGLAGEPALQRVERLLTELPPQEQALASGGLHLGVAADEYADEQDFLVRQVLGSDRASNGLVIGDMVPVGSTVRLHVRDADAANADLRDRLEAHRDASPGEVAGALVFSCNGRGASLFGASHGGVDHDPALVSSALGAPGVGGLFAAGELGPVAGRNALHGLTACLLAFPA